MWCTAVDVCRDMQADSIHDIADLALGLAPVDVGTADTPAAQQSHCQLEEGAIELDVLSLTGGSPSPGRLRDVVNAADPAAAAVPAAGHDYGADAEGFDAGSDCDAVVRTHPNRQLLN